MAAASFGGGPIRRADIVYQPDVVLIEAGPTAIRAVSKDHLTYTMDGRAAGVGQLVPGSVMYAAAMVVGRVVRISAHDALIDVTLAPVQITEIFKEAQLHFDMPLGSTTIPASGPNKASLSIVSGRPRSGAAPNVDAPASGGGEFVLTKYEDPPPADPAPESFCDSSGCGGPPPSDTPCKSPDCDPVKPVPETIGGALKLSWQDWELALAFKAKSDAQQGSSGSELGLKLQRSEKAKTVGLKYGVQIRIIGEEIHLKMDQTIAGGQLDSSHGSMSLEGVQRIEVGVFGGAADGNKDNIKVRFDWPVKIPAAQFFLGIPPGGIPVVVQVSFKFFAETAFSAQNSSLWGKGIYSVSGALGLAAGAPIVPTITTIQPITKSLGGVLLAPGGMLFGGEVRALIGLGLKDVVFAGPYGKWRFSVGVARGSVLSIYDDLNCRNVTYKIEGGIGAAMASESTVPDNPLKLDMEFIEKMVTVWAPGTSVYPSPERCAFKNTPLPGAT